MKYLTHSFLTLLFAALSMQAVAQDYQSLTDEDFAKHPYWIEMMQDQDVNFYDVQHAFEVYWKDREVTKGSGWKPFKRWEYMMSSRINPDGSRPAPDRELKAYNDYIASFPEQKSSSGNWENLGPFLVPPNKGYRGLGRLNAICFHPTDAQTIYVGAPAGGLWITHDLGTNWYTTTDGLPTLGVSAIAVDHTDPDIIYIGTGDRDAGDAPGLGVFKSFDAGQTWDQYNFGMGTTTVGMFVMHPDDSQAILAAASNGIYKTTNGGELWEKKQTGNFKDIVFKADDPTIVYATASGSFYRSADNGETWTEIENGIPSGSRGVIGVGVSNPNVVYFLLASGNAYGGTYYSDDAGLSFTEMSTSPNIMSWGCNGGDGGQAWYDLDMAVDPLDANTIFAGGVNCFKSTDAGATWQISSHWWGDCGVPAVHADLHILEYSPHDGRLYAGNDGGIYWTDNGGTNWTLISNGLAIGQVYKIGQSATIKNKVINGYQDNGTSTYMGTEDWYNNLGGDGMECAVDHEVGSYSYGTLYYGDIFRIINNNNAGQIAGNGSFGINESGGWVTPFVLHEEDATTMFVGYKNIWRGINIRSGNPVWTKITDAPGGNNSTDFRDLEHSPADVNILYAARENQTLFRTDNAEDDQPDWIMLSELPTSGSINDLEAHPTNPDIVYMCQASGVFKSTDRGVTWEDLTGSLPGVIVNDLVYYNNSHEGIYAGTDIGVFYRDAFLDDWQLFDNGFPASGRVTELEIYYEDGNPAGDVIRAGTYGRGLWTSDMYHATPVANFNASLQTAPPSCPISFNDLSAGVPTSWEWTFEGGNPSTSNVANPPEIIYESAGNYDVTLTVTNEFGSDTKLMENYIVIDETLLPDVDFSASGNIICSGETVYFTDLTQYCPTQWNWSFDPPEVEFVENTNAQSQNPVVTFLNNGEYSVILTATSGNGSATLTRESFILVGGYNVPFVADFSEGFESQNWTIENEDNHITWEITEPDWTPGDARAVYMNFFAYTAMNQRDNLISPAFNLSGLDEPHLTFNYAYTNRFAFRDSLIIKVSEDCGETWQRIYANGPDGNGGFETTEQMLTPFNPSMDEHWCGIGYGADCISLNLEDFAGAQNVKIMFQSMNKYGNNLYISDIEITSPTSIHSGNMTAEDFTIQPNPNEGRFTIKTYRDGVFDLKIFDPKGQIVKTGEITGETEIDISRFNKGIYLIKISNQNESWTEKVVIQ
jgi:PKD repeat protein/photosystem II stability/assembly factor-like uncharacterized protein